MKMRKIRQLDRMIARLDKWAKSLETSDYFQSIAKPKIYLVNRMLIGIRHDLSFIKGEK